MRLRTCMLWILLVSALGIVVYAQVQEGSLVGEPIFDIQTKEVPVYDYRIVYDEVCGMWDACVNVTIDKKQQENCTSVFECRDIPSYERYVKAYQTVEVSRKKIGERYKGKAYYGHVHLQDDRKAEWSVPVGDRNFKEYPSCRAYEIQKGVCHERKI